MSTRIFSEHMVLGGSADPLRVGPALIEVDGTSITRVTTGTRNALAASGELDGAQDLGEAWVMPAFVNAHTHLSLSCLRGIGGVEATEGNVVEDLYYQVETHLEEGDVRAFTRVGAFESLLAGVGTVWDHYYFGRAVAEELADVGLTAVVAPTLQDLGGPGQADFERALEATVSIDDDKSLRDRGVVAALGPHASDTVSDALFERAAALAEARNLPIHAHISQSHEEAVRSFERHGCSPVARLTARGIFDAGAGFLLVHGGYVSGPDLTLLDRARTVLGYCPWSQAQFVFPTPWLRWREAGFRVVLGTDCGASNDTVSVQQELRVAGQGGSFASTSSSPQDVFWSSGSAEHAKELAAHRSTAFSRRASAGEPGTLLHMVWAHPGGLHPHLPVGEIIAGARANLLVLDASHPNLWPGQDPLRALAMGDACPAIDAMMVNGAWIGERGSFARSLIESDAWRDARREASVRLERLLARAGIA